MKRQILLILLIVGTVKVYGQTTLTDSLKREIIHTVTEANLEFMAFTNPRFKRSDLYHLEDDAIIGYKVPRDIWGILEKAPYDPQSGYYYDFMMEVEDWEDNMYVVTKKSNCFAGEIYTDLRRKELYKRDTVCLNLDTALFINNKTFILYYDAKREFGKATFLAGNVYVYQDDIFATDKGSDNYYARMMQTRYRLYQFGRVRNLGSYGRINTPDTCDYYLAKFDVKTLSNKPVKVKFPKNKPYDYIEIEFYTNNKKYTKETGYLNSNIYKVKYLLKNDPKTIMEWYPTVTKLTDEEANKVRNGPENEFNERIIRKEDIPPLIEYDN